jgi:hypothetical protein
VNPFLPNPKASVVYQIPNANSLLGITELDLDIFAIAVGTGDLTANSTYTVWTVNLRNRNAEVRKAAQMPAGTTLNGLARLSRDTILSSDILGGKVHRIDLSTGEASVVLEDETMAGAPGINGIRIHANYLHFVNYGRGLYCRVPIDLKTGAATGPVEIISDDDRLVGSDDFAFSRTGDAAYIANLNRNDIIRVKANGDLEVVIGGPDGDVFVGPTSAQLGRTLLDCDTLYVVSSGAVFDPETLTFVDVEPGKITAVKL